MRELNLSFRCRAEASETVGNLGSQVDETPTVFGSRCRRSKRNSRLASLICSCLIGHAFTWVREDLMERVALLTRRIAHEPS